MNETLRRVQTLVLAGDCLVTDHGYELDEDGILAGDALFGIASAILVCASRREKQNARPSLTGRFDIHLTTVRPCRNGRGTGVLQDAVLRTAMPGHDTMVAAPLSLTRWTDCPPRACRAR
jgi:hypothetical protein